MERVKSTFLKRALSLHKSCRNRYTYLLCDTHLLIEDVFRRFKLPNTESYKVFLQQYEEKFSEIDAAFYQTDAMNADGWKGINRGTRHLVTRFSVHGFHHFYCLNKEFHEPNETCLCELCGEFCCKYHSKSCRFRKPLHRIAT